MKLTTTVNGVAVNIDLPGVPEAAYRATAQLLEQRLGDQGIKNRDAIREAFLYVLERSPGANTSDLWHHVVYRIYCDIYRKYRPQDPKQSWVRASGEALELAVEQIYGPVLAKHKILIVPLIGGPDRKTVLEEMRISADVGSAKLDMALYRVVDRKRSIFGGVHIKASLAERVSDDVPASRAMMAGGFLSPLWTLDVKSFPPPHGDLVNRGELGSPTNPSDKRKYTEEHGEFDNCYSANSRTAPSAGATRSGKRIVTIDPAKQPDQFALDVIERAKH